MKKDRTKYKRKALLKIEMKILQAKIGLALAATKGLVPISIQCHKIAYLGVMKGRIQATEANLFRHDGKIDKRRLARKRRKEYSDSGVILVTPPSPEDQEKVREVLADIGSQVIIL